MVEVCLNSSHLSLKRNHDLLVASKIFVYLNNALEPHVAEIILLLFWH